MIVNLYTPNDSRVRTRYGTWAFLADNVPLDFEVFSRKKAHDWVEASLRPLRYVHRGKTNKGVILEHDIQKLALVAVRCRKVWWIPCYLIMEKIIEGTNGSPGGRIASIHISASGLLADIITSKTSPAASGTIPCDIMTSFAMLPAS